MAAPRLSRLQSGKKRSTARPPALVTVFSVTAVLLFVAILFGARWTPIVGDNSWVPAGVRVAGSGEDAGPLATVPDPDPGDHLRGGLLSPDFIDSSCLSRYRAANYRQPSTHTLSRHLVSALRRYESVHRLCGPGTRAYALAIERLRTTTTANASAAPSSPDKCRYLVWTNPAAGLGNQIVSITSSFLYALLTDRVLLLHGTGDDHDDLFCEPFAGSTWILPRENFPVRGIERLGVHSHENLGNTLGRGAAVGAAPWVYLHLVDNDAHDRHFFCDDVQGELRRVPWLVLKANLYFVPGLFLVPQHERALARMFPRRDTVFHHLVRYLFHPSNTVWNMAMRYHAEYFAGADERVGVQVREFKSAPITSDKRYGQILSCMRRENILPVVGALPKANITGASPAKRKAVVFVSLNREYSERLRDDYQKHGVAGDEMVRVFQPTHLGVQRLGDLQHNQNAFAEMTLLSFSDVMVTTAGSTFGYVSQGMAGLRPWVLMWPVDRKAPDTPCRLAVTVEPCFHAPPNYDCRAKAKGDTGRMVPHIRHCVDFPQGVQLVE